MDYYSALYTAIKNKFKTIFNRYKTNTITDGGTIRSDSITKEYMKMAQVNRIEKSIRFAWLGEAGSKIVNGKVTKAYSFDFNNYQNNATQATAGSQPYISGNIAPNEKLGLKNPNGGSAYMTHPTISFAANEAWSISTVLNWSGDLRNTLTGKNSGFYNVISLATATDRVFNFSGFSGLDTVSAISTSSLIGKNIIISYVADGTGNLKIYANGVYITQFTTTTSYLFERIGATADVSYGTRGQIKAHIIRSQALTSTQVANEYNLLRSIYPEIESVQIGTQTWATSNCEMVATPMGNVIANVTENGNVEKITNGGFDTDTYWFKDPTWSIDTVNGRAVATNANFPNAIYKPGVLAVGKWYKCTFTVTSISSGAVCITAGNNSQGISRNSVGTYTEYLLADTQTALVRAASPNTNAVIDNVSFQEIGWSGSQELYDGIYAQTAEAASAVEKIVNGDYSNTTNNYTTGVNQTSIIQNNRLEVTVNVANANWGAWQITPTSGKWYKFTFSHVGGSITNLKYSLEQDGYKLDSIAYANNSTVTVYYKAISNSIIKFMPVRDSLTGTAFFDNISIKELGVTGQEATYEYAALKAAAMWCYFNNDNAVGAVYGKLYNWFAVKLLDLDMASANFGWHVPTQAEFNTLVTTLGGTSVAGGKMKVTGTDYWDTPNTGATNISGFSAIGTSIRNVDGSFSTLKQANQIWSANESNSTDAKSLDIAWNGESASINDRKKGRGDSLRLIKNTTELLYDSLSSLLTDSTGDSLIINT